MDQKIEQLIDLLLGDEIAKFRTENQRLSNFVDTTRKLLEEKMENMNKNIHATLEERDNNLQSFLTEKIEGSNDLDQNFKTKIGKLLVEIGNSLQTPD